ncbi:hypothetical protein KKB99_01615 [bacterium]|nr:hypothetical protein [bacterium]MBU1024684.1 hypothetical protein [bacterium]
MKNELEIKNIARLISMPRGGFLFTVSTGALHFGNDYIEVKRFADSTGIEYTDFTQGQKTNFRPNLDRCPLGNERDTGKHTGKHTRHYTAR